MFEPTKKEQIVTKLLQFHGTISSIKLIAESSKVASSKLIDGKDGLKELEFLDSRLYEMNTLADNTLEEIHEALGYYQVR